MHFLINFKVQTGKNENILVINLLFHVRKAFLLSHPSVRNDILKII